MQQVTAQTEAVKITEMASRTDIEFKTGDNVTIRGWFFSSTAGGSGKLPTLILSHGFTAIKEMDLDKFAAHFSSTLPLNCLVYDQRGFGASDTGVGQPRYEIIPANQHSDLQDAITYAQTRPDVDPDRIGIWGSSFSGGHVLFVGAVDKRVKCVMAQAPLVDGYANFRALVRSDFQPGLDKLFEQDRITRSQGKEAMTIPVVHENPLETSALPTPDSYKFFSQYEAGGIWKNAVTARSMEYLRAYAPAVHVQEISPAPLLMTVAESDVLTPTKLALEVYAKALEPKQLNILKGAGHFDAYAGDWWERNISVQTDFLKRNLC